MIRTHIFFLILVVSLIGCDTSIGTQKIEDTGTVKYLSIENGFYGIVSDKNQYIDPINLSNEYQIDGLKIRFTYKERTDLSSFHQWGKIVELVGIEKIK